MKVPTIKPKKMSKSKLDNFINNELAEVCEMLVLYDQTTPKQKKQFLKYANAFRKFGAIHKDLKVKINKKEVLDVAKRLTDAEKQEREVKRILAKIIKLEKVHPQELVERACYRYKMANLDRRRAEKEMEELEEKLANAKKRLK